MKKTFSFILLVVVLLVLLPMTVLAKATSNVIGYLTYDENRQRMKTEECSEYTVMNRYTDYFVSGKWYYLSDSLTMYSGNISINGDVHLIIADGKCLTVEKGISGNGHLYIHSQSSNNPGQLICHEAITVSDLTVNGANVFVTTNVTGYKGDIGQNGGSGANGITVGTLTVNGGNITATGGTGGIGGAGYGGLTGYTGGSGGSGISAASIIVNYGSITATGGDGGSGGDGGPAGSNVSAGDGGIGGTGGSGISVTKLIVNGGKIKANGGTGGGGGIGPDSLNTGGGRGGNGGIGGCGISTVCTLDTVNDGNIEANGGIGGGGGAGGTGKGWKNDDGATGSFGTSINPEDKCEIDGKVTVRKNENENYYLLPDSEKVSVYRYAKITATKANPPQPGTYRIISGAWQSVRKDAVSATFASNADFSKFDHVEVDGKTVASKYYTVESGSTVITFNRDFLATLSTDTLRTDMHSLDIVSSDGYASTYFYMTYIPHNPETGDDTNLALLMMLLLASMGTLLLISAKAKKRNED